MSQPLFTVLALVVPAITAGAGIALGDRRAKRRQRRREEALCAFIRSCG